MRAKRGAGSRNFDNEQEWDFLFFSVGLRCGNRKGKVAGCGNLVLS